jgi:hypothetical protein
MFNIVKSAKSKISDNQTIEPIHFIGQFFIHKNAQRHLEILNCLNKICENKFITKVHLLNERIYTTEELKTIHSSKIVQSNINRRLIYSDIFDYVENEHLTGYIIFANSDIFFDDTISSLYNSNLKNEKAFYALLRFEYNTKNIKKSSLFGPRSDSQDTWIFHSNFNICKSHRTIFDFNFGKPGCDNKAIYNLQLLGYNIYNEPYKIKSYHHHSTQIRDYNSNDAIPPPRTNIFPYMTSPFFKMTTVDSFLQKITNDYNDYNMLNENTKLYTYLKTQINVRKPFVIPQITGYENILVHLTYTTNVKTMRDGSDFTALSSQIKTFSEINATNFMSIMQYSKHYINAFNLCDMFSVFEPYGNEYKQIGKSHDFVSEKFKTKEKIWKRVFDLFNYVNIKTPWSHALSGKKILIISNIKQQLDAQIHNRAHVYGVDFFPNCTFVTIQSPEMKEENDWQHEYTCFCKKIDEIKDDFEIALVSAKGFSNPIIGHLHSIGKSGIHVGDVLGMYFGILDEKWNSCRPEIAKLYANEYWIRK